VLGGKDLYLMVGVRDIKEPSQEMFESPITEPAKAITKAPTAPLYQKKVLFDIQAFLILRMDLTNMRSSLKKYTSTTGGLSLRDLDQNTTSTDNESIQHF
jgi:hypothetical protein